MGGGHGEDLVRWDRAIERWGHMRENSDLHFRWNPRTAGIALALVGLVPLGLYKLLANDVVRPCARLASSPFRARLRRAAASLPRRGDKEEGGLDRGPRWASA